MCNNIINKLYTIIINFLGWARRKEIYISRPLVSAEEDLSDYDELGHEDDEAEIRKPEDYNNCNY